MAISTQDGLDALVEQKKVEAEARKAAQMKQADAKRQRIDNLNSDGHGGTTKERSALPGVERLWKSEMEKAFPELAIAQWAAKERGQAKNLITKYDGRSVEAAVKYVVREWKTFNDRVFKGQGRIPTVGIILKLHESVVPVAVQWEKHAEVLEEWEKFYAEHPYDDPPDELERKYRAAKSDLTRMGLA